MIIAATSTAVQQPMAELVHFILCFIYNCMFVSYNQQILGKMDIWMIKCEFELYTYPNYLGKMEQHNISDNRNKFNSLLF